MECGIDAEEDTSMRPGGSAGDGESVMVGRERRGRRNSWRLLRQQRPISEQRSITSRPSAEECAPCGCHGRCAGPAQATTSRRGGDAPRVERLRSSIREDERLRAIEADSATGRGRRLLDAVGDVIRIRDGLGERRKAIDMCCEMRYWLLLQRLLEMMLLVLMLLMLMLMLLMLVVVLRCE